MHPPRRPRTTRAWLPALATLVLVACGDSLTDPPFGSVVRMEVTSAVPAQVTPDSELEVEIRVRVDGMPAQGVLVELHPGASGGSVTPAQVLTDGNGRASALWQPGTQAGGRTLLVEGPETAQATLETEVIPGPAAAVVPGEPLAFTARRELRRAVVAFEDGWGNPAEAPEGVTWTSDDPDVAEVGESGIVRAVANGATTLRIHTPAGEAGIPVEVAFRGIITITFDDGFRTVYERGFAILEDHGLKANVGVVTRSVDEQWGDFMTMEQLQTLADAGWSMVSHTVTHANLTELSPEDVQSELEESRAWLEARGFGGAGYFVVPYHEWDAELRDAVAEVYDMARGRPIYFDVDETVPEWIPEDPMDIAGLDFDFYGFEEEWMLDRLRQHLETTIAEGRIFDVFFHRVEEERLEAFEAVIGVLAEFAEDVTTWDVLLEQAAPPPMM
jgi:peptidoglycan/xylan/chitin deacetylase (PgdA/CDA1 family)